MIYYTITRQVGGKFSELVGFTEKPSTVQMLITLHTDEDFTIYELDIDHNLNHEEVAHIISRELEVMATEQCYLYVDLSQDGKEYIVWSLDMETAFEEMNFTRMSERVHEYLTSVLSIQSMSLLLQTDIRDELLTRLGSLMMNYIIPMVSEDVSCENKIIKQLGIDEDDSMGIILDRVKLINKIGDTLM